MSSAAAVIGQDFDLDVLTAVTATDEDRLLDVLDGAAAAGLIEEQADTPGRYRFVHARVPHPGPGPRRRAQRMHHRIARPGGLGAEAAGRVEELAHHWLAATRPADIDRALHYARAAGDAALAALAPLDAVRWYTQARELLDRRVDLGDDGRVAVLVGLAEAQAQAGDPIFHRPAPRRAGSPWPTAVPSRLSPSRTAPRCCTSTRRPGWTPIVCASSTPRSRRSATAMTSCGPGCSPPSPPR